MLGSEINPTGRAIHCHIRVHKLHENGVLFAPRRDQATNQQCCTRTESRASETAGEHFARTYHTAEELQHRMLDKALLCVARKRLHINLLIVLNSKRTDVLSDRQCPKFACSSRRRTNSR